MFHIQRARLALGCRRSGNRHHRPGPCPPGSVQPASPPPVKGYVSPLKSETVEGRRGGLVSELEGETLGRLASIAVHERESRSRPTTERVPHSQRRGVESITEENVRKFEGT